MLSEELKKLLEERRKAREKAGTPYDTIKEFLLNKEIEKAEMKEAKELYEQNEVKSQSCNGEPDLTEAFFREDIRDKAAQTPDGCVIKAKPSSLGTGNIDPNTRLFESISDEQELKEKVRKLLDELDYKGVKGWAFLSDLANEYLKQIHEKDNPKPSDDSGPMHFRV